MSSSDSEDEEQMKMFLEASDTTFLNNDMFKEKGEKETKDDSAANGSITNKEEGMYKNLQQESVLIVNWSICRRGTPLCRFKVSKCCQLRNYWKVFLKRHPYC